MGLQSYDDQDRQAAMLVYTNMSKVRLPLTFFAFSDERKRKFKYLTIGLI